jgi:hypothetical protein
MIIVSFATNDDIYPSYLDRLRRSCEASGLQHDLAIIPAQRRETACRSKPKFLLSMLEKHSQPIVWLDADAVVMRSFSLPDGDWDVGLVPNTIRNRRHAYPMASFVVALRPTPGSASFLNTWDYLCGWDGPKGDHHRLHPTRMLMRKDYVETSLVKPLRRAVVRDYGKHKENTIVGDLEFYAERILRRLTFTRGRRPELGSSPGEV